MDEIDVFQKMGEVAGIQQVSFATPEEAARRRKIAAHSSGSIVFVMRGLAQLNTTELVFTSVISTRPSMRTTWIITKSSF